MTEGKEGAAVVAAPIFLPDGFTLGSRIVEILHVEKFSMLPKDETIRKEVVKKIGSAWKKGTKDIIRGLNRYAVYFDVNDPENRMDVDEETTYLPSIAGISADSPDWEKAAREYWANFTLEVPATGIKLEIGFGKNGRPLNINDYINYNMCLQHPHVAVTEEELATRFNDQFELYIIDKKKQKEQELADFDVTMEADTIYARIINGKNVEAAAKIDYLLEMEGGERGAGINPDNLTNKEKYFEIKRMKDKNASRFIMLFNDPNLGTKAFVKKLVAFKHLSKEGDSYFYGDRAIGSSLMEVIAYLDNPANSEVRLRLEAQLKASLK